MGTHPIFESDFDCLTEMDQSARRARQVFKIPSYLGVHKSELERKMKTRRDRVATQQETFRDYSAYINKESVAGYLDQKWSIPPSARPQLNAKAVHFRQVKNQVLSRRAELTEKLRREETEQVAELKAIKESSRNGDLEALTRRVEEIKREKETARREVAQARKYQMWKRDNSRLRSAEVERRREEMVDIWTDQHNDRQVQLSLDADEKDRERKRVDLEREEAEIQQQLAHQQRHEKQQRLKDELHQQIVELTQRETRQNQLKNEERELMIEQGELHHERQLQIAKEKKEKQRSYQKILYRQYRAQILRRAHEIERELEEDLAVLERVALESRRDENDQSARRERARQYASDALLITRQKLKEERDRQEEIDFLYREQAEQYWEGREAEWARDQAARACLLKAVLAEREDQVNERLQRVHTSKAELVADREAVLASIEATKIEMEQELATQRTKRRVLIEGLNEGIDEKHERIRAAIDFNNKENDLTEQTAREIEDLELEEVELIKTTRPPARQA